MNPRAWFAGLAIATLVATTAPAFADSVAEVTNLGDSLLFRPTVPFEQISVTVVGPCNFVYRDVITRGDLLVPVTSEMIDGAYVAELVVSSHLDSSVLEVLNRARATGDEAPVNQLCRTGQLPSEPLKQHNTFQVVEGRILFDPTAIEDEKATPARGGFAPEASGRGSFGTKDFQTFDDLIVDGSACVGFDCVNNEDFGFDTLRLKENNLRIHFDDTSTVSGYPKNDWRLTANSADSGGASSFAIEDVTGSKTPFTVTAGAPTSSLFLAASGRAGLRTSTPTLDIHVSTGNTPAIRLEQTNGGGFTAQSWDIAGNEANFFIRDVTAGSRLPLRIRPGAPNSAIDVASDGDIGIGTASPEAKVSILANVVTPTEPMLLLKNTGGPPRLEQTNGAGNFTYRQTVTSGGLFNVDEISDGVIEFSLAANGNLTLSGNVITTNCPVGCGPDYVFAPDYDLMSLDQLGSFIAENRHLPNVPPAKVMETEGINMTQLQLKMLEKIEELTLYTLEQHRTLQAQNETIQGLRDRLTALESPGAALD